MAGDGVTADLDGMNRAAQQFQQTAEAAAVVGNKLASDLGPLGNFWGGDSTGKTFEQKYLPAVATWMGQAGVVGYEGLPGISDAVSGWAGTYDDQGQSEETDATQLRSEIDGAR